MVYVERFSNGVSINLLIADWYYRIGLVAIRRYDMLSPDKMTHKQTVLMNWVKAHDWGRAAYLSNDGKTVIGLTEATTNSSKVVDIPADMDTIKAWAGY